jgi:predicted lipase
LWKERQNIVQKTAQVEEIARKQTVKAAATGNARGSNESAPKKIYRRADIINLMKNDPERYAALSDEIMRAYAEKRVR